MNIPTSTFINLPSDFLPNIFNIAGYLFNNFLPLLEVIIGFSVVLAIIGLIISIFNKQ